jgi:hypothetical protein
VSEERFIAPPDLIAQLAKDLEINFSRSFSTVDSFQFLKLGRGLDGIISTIPMQHMMNIFRIQNIPEFRFVHGGTLSATVPNCNAHTSLYLPDPGWPFYRVSITGDNFIGEYTLNDELNRPMEDKEFMIEQGFTVLKNLFGIDHLVVQQIEFKTKLQKFAKIEPIDDIVRKRFIAELTDKHRIYSLGRFATWRPGLLLDDLVKDVRAIEKWMIKQDGGYSVKFAR